MKAKSVAAGYDHSLFLLDDGSVQAAGWNFHGQLGDSTVDSQVAPGTIYGKADNAVQISAGYDFSYILTASGQVWAAGYNMDSQLGDGTTETRLTFVSTLATTKAVAAGRSHGLFLRHDGRVFAAGRNYDGELGDGLQEPMEDNIKDGLHKPTSHEDGLHAPMEAGNFKNGLHKRAASSKLAIRCVLP